MMYKFICLLSARNDAAAFGEWVLKKFAPTLAQKSSGCVVNLVMAGEEKPAWDSIQEAAWDVVLEIYSESADILGRLEILELRYKADRIAVYAITELVEKDDGLQRGQPTQGIKVIALLTGRNDVARTDLRRRWDEHVPLANRIHVGVRRYVRNWVDSVALAPDPMPPMLMGASFQYLNSQKDLIERFYDKPESAQVIGDDVARFVASYDVLQTTEYVITPRQST